MTENEKMPFPPAADGRNSSLFDRPERVLMLFIVSSVLLWTLQCSLLQSVLSIDIYETIVWGSQMQWGHSKHPPLSGWIGYFFSWATGHSDWGMYLGAQLCLGIGVWFSFKLARLFFDRYRAATAAMMLYFLVFYTPSETKFSTYFVEIAIAPAAAYLLLRALRDSRFRRWLPLGAVCALGILNKYSFGLILAAFALIVLTRREYRRVLATVEPYAALPVFLLMIFPHLKWLYDHDFVCFRHVGGRLSESHSLLMPLLVLAVTVYPAAVELLALMLALFRFGADREGGAGRLAGRMLTHCRRFFSVCGAIRDREALHFSAILTLLPGAVYVLLALCGADIILMWQCSVFSASGILVLSLFPVEIDRAVFKRFSLLLAGFIAAIFAVTTVDSLFRTTSSMHLDPDEVVRTAESVWRRHSAEPVRVVVGGLRYAALFSHYSAGHPPVCDPEDAIMTELYRDRIRRYGALLIDSNAADFNDFFRRLGRKKVHFDKNSAACRSLLGKSRRKNFVVGFLAPSAEPPPASPRQ